MKLTLRSLLLVACAALSGCMGSSSSSTSQSVPLGPPSDVLRVGDKITFRLTGVPGGGDISEIQIPESGDINISLLSQSFHAANRTPSAVAAEITEAFKTEKIYSTPVVTIIPEERYVSVGGDVRGPSRVMYTPDLTLLTAINSCGGFTDYAMRRSVRIIRGPQVIYVDAAAAAAHPGADPPLFPGDQIYVPRTIF